MKILGYKDSEWGKFFDIQVGPPVEFTKFASPSKPAKDVIIMLTSSQVVTFRSKKKPLPDFIADDFKLFEEVIKLPNHYCFVVNDEK